MQHPILANVHELAERIAAVRQRVAEAAERVGRSAEEVTIVAVTKTVPLERIRAALELGLHEFGENRVQEAEAKIAELPGSWGMPSPTSVQPRWHLIGHLQTNKAKRAVQLFDLIHSIDSVRLAATVSAHAERAGRAGPESAPHRVPILLEVNTSGEATKFGLARDAVGQALAEIVVLSGLRIEGLMTIAPHVDDPEDARPAFRALRELRDALRERFPDLPLPILSMGMTNDFEVAIEEGSTLVRVGRAIFGERPV